MIKRRKAWKKRETMSIARGSPINVSSNRRGKGDQFLRDQRQGDYGYN